MDRQGFLWVGSREGLFRYDGYTATHFKPEINNEKTISDTDIRNLYEDSEGNIWVSTNTAGLNRYDPSSKKFTRYRHDASDHTTISNDSVYDIIETAEGNYWVGTDIGLNYLDSATNTFKRYYFEKDNPNSISHDYIYNLYIDDNDDLWVTTVGGGINKKVKGEDRFIRHRISEITGDSFHDEVFAIKEAANGGFYLGTRRGLIQYNPQTREVQTVDIEAGEIRPGVVTLATTDDNQLLVGTIERGILRYDKANNRYEPFNSNPLGSAGQLPALPVLALHYYNKKLFVGTWGGGVYVARLGQLPFRVLGNGGDGYRLDNRNVTALYQDNTEQLVGTFGGGAQRLDVNTGAVSEQLATNELFKTEGVLAITQYGDWTYAGTSTGLWQIKDGQGTYYQHSIDDEKSIGNGYINSLVATNEGVWVGTGTDGLYWKNHEDDEFKSFKNKANDPSSLSGYYITTILQSDDNTLWVGTRSSGLNRCRITPWSCQRLGMHNQSRHGLLSDNITHVHQTHNGEVWVATNGAGVYQLVDQSTIQFRAWGEADGLSTNVVTSIQQDDNGVLWLASREGISQLNPKNGNIRNYKAESGLLITHFNRTTTSEDEKNLYFGGIGGVLVIPKATPFITAPEPTVKITGIEKLRTVSKEKQLNQVAQYHTMDYGDVFSVEFAVLDYSEKPHRYQYRMSEEEPWIDLGGRREVTFYNLAPDNYQLAIRGQDVFGVWGETESIDIEVVPPFWMENWFKLLVLIILATLIISLHRLRLSKLKARNKELMALQRQKEKALQDIREKEAELMIAFKGLRNLTNRLETAKEEERQHISRELHDELGQTLTATKINLQVIGALDDEALIKERLDRSISMVDGMIEQVRNVSLSLRPPLLDEAGLVPALEYYLEVIEERTGLVVELKASKGVSGNSHDIRVVVFRVIQEAISNVLRHANASKITISLSVEDEAMCIRIVDDGNGYDINAVNERIKHGEHLGLLGMMERVKGVNGDIKLYSEPGKGSTIEARIPR
ncbi:ligand-binding sensor domain-containing protein [Kangiella marina]|uniref:ligand-binding sensor domain-containing protein n=1 Tax=Kangiella marina TaxID=1079178 RepID=UPI0031EFEDF9